MVLTLRPSELKPVAAQMGKMRALEGGLDGGGDGDEEGLPSPEVMKVFKLLADAKVGAVKEWIEATLFDEGSFDSSRKALIFAHHHSVHQEGSNRRPSRLQMVGLLPLLLLPSK